MYTSIARSYRSLAFSLALLTPVFAVGLLGRAQAEEPRQYYSIHMNENLIGYAAIVRDTLEEDGQQYLRIKSQVSLKVAMLGTPRNTLLDSETLLNADTKQPIRCTTTDTTNAVVRHVDCEFQPDAARGWIYSKGEDRGQPVETTLPPGTVLLGSNNFAHWQLMLQAANQIAVEDVAKLSVYLPDSQQLQEFELRRGATQEVSLESGHRTCVAWTAPSSNISLFADAQTQELVRMELASQKVTIELASEGVIKQLQKSRAEEVLAQHFVQSSARFDDFLNVRSLMANIDVQVIGSGVTNDASVLNSPMQTFTGSKEGAHVVGQVEITTTEIDADLSPPFPTPAKAEPAEWLDAEQYIETDDANVIAQSKALTQSATSRWDAVQSIGHWIHEEIAYTIADSPSARLALEKRTGDCGPHSTLMIAMLRAQGIPSRLVGGLVYTPTFGGSFGQHAWVEVDMGKLGWVAVDPTTGEFERLSATHIKLFEGMGGVLPKTVDVIAFEPPNQQAETSGAPRPARPIAWQLDKEYTLKYTQAGKELGKETFRITEVEVDGEKAFRLTAEINLRLNLLMSLQSTTTLTVQPDASPLAFERDLAAGLQKVHMQGAFSRGKVKMDISGSTEISREIELPAQVYCFDNNFTASFALLATQLDFQPEQKLTIQTMHPSSLQIIPLTFGPQKSTAIKIGDREVECFEYAVDPIKNTFWIAPDGRLLRAQQGDLTIELTELD